MTVHGHLMPAQKRVRDRKDKYIPRNFQVVTVPVWVNRVKHSCQSCIHLQPHTDCIAKEFVERCESWDSYSFHILGKANQVTPGAVKNRPCKTVSVPTVYTFIHKYIYIYI